jgi:hypothetical protein
MVKMEQFIVCITSSIPLLFVVFGIKYSSRVLKRIGLYLYLAMLGIVVSAHWHFQSVYGLPFFSSPSEMAIMALVLMLLGFFLLVAVLFGLIHDYFKHPERFHQTKQGALFILGLLAHLGVLGFLMYPLSGKWEYVNILKHAEIVFAKDEDIRDGKIRVELVFSSPLPCWRNCSSEDYRHLFMVKNYTDEPMKVRLKIELFDDRKESLDTIASLPIVVQPGEYRPVITKWTDEKSSVWDQWSYRSEEPIAYFRYWYDARPVR